MTTALRYFVATLLGLGIGLAVYLNDRPEPLAITLEGAP